MFRGLKVELTVLSLPLLPHMNSEDDSHPPIPITATQVWGQKKLRLELGEMKLKLGSVTLGVRSELRIWG